MESCGVLYRGVWSSVCDFFVTHKWSYATTALTALFIIVYVRVLDVKKLIVL